jgi:hypothetical protein
MPNSAILDSCISHSSQYLDTTQLSRVVNHRMKRHRTTRVRILALSGTDSNGRYKTCKKTLSRLGTLGIEKTYCMTRTWEWQKSLRPSLRTKLASDSKQPWTLEYTVPSCCFRRRVVSRQLRIVGESWGSRAPGGRVASAKGKGLPCFSAPSSPRLACATFSLAM